jgi:hypothetical protein
VMSSGARSGVAGRLYRVYVSIVLVLRYLWRERDTLSN